METLTWLIQQYGYAIVFLFTLLEGETIVALAGFLAQAGHLNLAILIPVAIVGASLGDTLYFLFGRWKGREWIAARPKYAAKVERIHLLIERHQYWLIFGSRFLYGFRMIIPIAIGTSRVPLSRFLSLNLLGAFVWAHIFAGGGYLFGSAIEQVIGHLKRAEKFLIFGVLLGIILVQCIFFLKNRIVAGLEKAEKKLESAGGNGQEKSSDETAKSV